ncbi:MAG: twin-arginine translocase subunit TatC [Anaerolineales bacterium]|nr:twin-arginine translocase subunit TatC [Anaerolineales bacterium]
MRTLFRGIWQGILVYFRVLFYFITFPFVFVFRTLTLPFRLFNQFRNYLNTDPDERPVADIFVDLTTRKETRVMLMEQVEALRAHLLRSVIVLAVAVIAAFGVAQELMVFLAEPIGGLEKLQAIQVTEEIGVFMRVAMSAGIAVAFPYIAFEVWWFAAPGLKPREKKMGLVGIPLAILLFLTGMAFTFFVLLPTALPFLGGFTQISEFWAANEYFKFVTGLMVWIGIFFEFPLVIYVLTSMGLVKPDILRQQWRLAVVIIAVLAAAITPTVDPVNMGLVMLPMTLLYFISIGLSYIAYAGRRRRAAEVQEPVIDEGAG